MSFTSRWSNQLSGIQEVQPHWYVLHRSRCGAVLSGKDSHSLQYSLRCNFEGVWRFSKLLILWSGRRDSNPRPSAPKTDPIVYGTLLKLCWNKCF